MATCTAPGIPSCTITCANGCYAIYWHPTNKCITGCNNNPPPPVAKSDDRFSIQISEMSASDVDKLFGAWLPAAVTSKLKSSAKAVSVSLANTTVKDLADAIQKAI